VTVKAAVFGVMIAGCLVGPASAQVVEQRGAASADAAVATAGVLAGRVVAERTGEPLAGALIEVVEAGRRAVADEAGRFTFGGLRPGRYTVAVTLLGRAVGRERVDVGAGAAVELEIALGIEPVVLEALGVRPDREALVGSRLTRVPGSAHVLTSDRLSRQKLAFDDAHALLRQVPGVNVLDEEGHGRRPNIGMRGTGVGRSAKITVLEDGVLAAPAPYSAPAAYYFPVFGRMDAIEVRKGSSQVRHGPWSTGGVLNLVSSPIPASASGLVEIAGGDDANRKLRGRAGGTHGAFGWLLETYQLRTDGFKRLDTGDDTGFDLHDYLLKLRLAGDPGARVYQDIELRLGRTEEASRETYLGLADVDFSATPLRRYAGTERDRLDTEHRSVQLRHFVRPFAAVDVTTTLYRNDFTRNWYKLDRVGSVSLAAVLADPAYAAELSYLRGADSPEDVLLVRANARDYVSQGVQSVVGLSFAAVGAHALELGVRVHRDSEDRFQHDDRYRMLGGRMELTTAGAPGSQDNRMAEASALAFFVEDRITLGSWTLTPGVRHESIDFTSTRWTLGDGARAGPTRVERNGVRVWVPGVGVARTIGAHAQLFGGVHRGFGPPGPGADERTRPESSVNYELGGRVQTPSLGVQLVGFYNDYTNMLGAATLASGGSGTGELFNGGAVLARGVEASADYDVGAGRGWAVRVPLHAAYTYTSAEFRTSFQSGFGEWGSVQAGDELPYLPRHQASAGVAVEASRWRVGATAAGASAMRTRAGSGPLVPASSTDAFVVINTSAELGVLPAVRLFSSVQNVTDARYIVARRPAGARPGLPRTVMLGVRAEMR
jgi:Fe(3+) dicitrate transport protein